MTNNQGISIVIGTFNGEKYLKAQLESIASQTLAPREIIISDDCSTDNTPMIIREFAQNTKTIPVKIINNKKNLGFGLNYLNASRAATSEIIAFSDQDDIWRSDKLEICAPAFSDRRVSLVSHTATLVDADRKVIGDFQQFISRNGSTMPLEGDPWGGYFGFSILFRRAVLDLVPISKTEEYLYSIGIGAHDRLICNLSALSGIRCRVNQPLVEYRQHGGNVFGMQAAARQPRTRVTITTESECRIRAARAITEMLEESGELDGSLPLYNQRLALSRWRRIAKSQVARHVLYVTHSRLLAYRIWMVNLLTGVYSMPRSGRASIMTGLKDLAFAFLQPN